MEEDLQKRYVREVKKEHPDKPRECHHCQLFLYCDNYMEPAQQLHHGTSGKAILIICESPDIDIQVLGRYINKHLNDHDVWLTTSVKCSPKGFKMKKAFINYCSKFVKEDINNIGADTVITLGSWALESWKEVNPD